MKKNIFIIIIAFLFTLSVSAVNEPAQLSGISAKSAILINADTGTVIFEKNAYERRAMASTTKIMSALLTLEAGGLDTPFVVDSRAIYVEGTSMGLREGDIVTRRALVVGMLLPSGNDASQAAAVSVSGSIPAFVELMNDKAEQFGMNDTHFANPSGLDAPGHYSTAYDLSVLTQEALKNSDFAAICSQQSLQIEFGNPPHKRWLSNNNRLLYMYEGTIGVKTGFTDNARRTLVSAATRNGVTLIAVTLNAYDDWNDHISMYNYGFSQVVRQTVDYDVSGLYVNVTCNDKGTVPIRVSELPRLPLTDEEMRRVRVKTLLLPFIYTGFDEGEPVGMLEFYFEEKLIASVPLVTAEACESPADKLHPVAVFMQYLSRL